MQQYIIIARDGTDADAKGRRANTRPTHLAGAKKLKQNGNYVMGGAILDDEGQMIGSTMVLQFETPEQLQQWMNQEPYIVQKVWQQIEVKPFRVAEV